MNAKPTLTPARITILRALAEGGESHMDANKIIRQMRPWYTAHKVSKLNYEDMRADSEPTRTDQQRVWDHAILAAAEFIRRLHNYDESEAALIHLLLSTCLPKED